jgi:probable phosphoglycerate mutase
LKQIKPTTFYYIRHGQTDANKNEQMCGGDWDIPLNDEGRRQAKSASDKKELLSSIDTVYVSPMIRAKETAKILFEGLEKDIQEAEGLREWRVGDWESKAWSEVPNPFNTTEDPKNGETRQEFEERVINTVSELLELSAEKSTLFVAHGAVAHVLFTYLGVDVPYVKNATLYKVSVMNMKWSLEEP